MILFLKGFIIGIGKIVPGVSGSVLALLVGLYDKGIDAISHFSENKKKNLLFLINVGLGFGFAVMAGSQFILQVLEHYYFVTMLLFCGLISGTIPVIKHKIETRSSKKVIVMLGLFALFTCLTFLKPSHPYQFSYTLGNFLFFILIGFIEAATMIIPGISGTAIMMLLGVYSLLLTTFGNVMNLQYLQYNLFILAPYGIGILIGALLVTKGMDYCMKKHTDTTFYAILGFSLSSLLLLFQKALEKPFTLTELLLGIIFFIGGYLLSRQFEEK